MRTGHSHQQENKCDPPENPKVNRTIKPYNPNRGININKPKDNVNTNALKEVQGKGKDKVFSDCLAQEESHLIQNMQTTSQGNGLIRMLLTPS